MPQEVSNISASSLAVTLCLGFLLLVLPRRYALAPMFIGGSYLTLGQYLLIGEWHFNLIRILIAFGFVRLLVRREIFSIKLNIIDKVLIAWLLVSSLLYVLISGDTYILNERLGGIYNTVGTYFFVRAVVRDFDGVLFTVKMLAIIITPLAIPFLVEYTMGRNPFSILDGVPEFTQIREGKLRCQGAFLHPILAGTFGATVVPMFVGLWGHSVYNRLLIISAILTGTFIVVASSSSGPFLAYFAAVIGLFCWNFKSHMRAIRWSIAILLLALHMIMNAPVWFLMSRIADFTGGSGWYRSALIDAAVSHFDEWWLIGTTYTVHWMPTGIAANPKMTDIVNHYVAQGVNGGLLSLTLFIWLISLCFMTTGLGARNESRYSSPERFMIWSLGCTVFSHAVSFFSVSYFDQMNIFWYSTIGMIAALVDDGSRRVYESRQAKGSNISQVSVSPPQSETV